MIDIHDPVTQAVLGIAVGFTLWGVDKITDKDNLEALNSIPLHWKRLDTYLTNHPNIVPDVHNAVRIMVFIAGFVYFAVGLELLHVIGLF